MEVASKSSEPLLQEYIEILVAPVGILPWCRSLISWPAVMELKVAIDCSLDDKKTAKRTFCQVVVDTANGLRASITPFHRCACRERRSIGGNQSIADCSSILAERSGDRK